MGFLQPQSASKCLSRRKALARAFTLIEVLVVVAIIALLIAILLPSLARSRENARTTICRAQLKEWANAFQMYANAHLGSLPFEDRPKAQDDIDHNKVWDDTGWVCWYDCMDKYFGTKKLEPALKVCPSLVAGDPNREESYKMNSKLAETNIAAKPDKAAIERSYRRLNSLKFPSMTVVLFDGDTGGGTPQEPDLDFKGRWRLGNFKGDDVNYRHLMGTNLQFADGHVEYLHKKAVKDKSIRNGPLIWQPPDMGPWNPDPDDLQQ